MSTVTIHDEIIIAINPCEFIYLLPWNPKSCWQKVIIELKVSLYFIHLPFLADRVFWFKMDSGEVVG